MKTPDTRLGEWQEFSKIVEDHILGYANLQYKDKGLDQVTEFSVSDCVREIKKYCNRFGKNQRPGQEKIDLKKMSHYACMAYFKLVELEDKEIEKKLFTIEGDHDTILNELKLEKNKKYKIIVEETE